MNVHLKDIIFDTYLLFTLFLALPLFPFTPFIEMANATMEYAAFAVARLALFVLPTKSILYVVHHYLPVALLSLIHYKDVACAVRILPFHVPHFHQPNPEID